MSLALAQASLGYSVSLLISFLCIVVGLGQGHLHLRNPTVIFRLETGHEWVKREDSGLASRLDGQPVALY